VIPSNKPNGGVTGVAVGGAGIGVGAGAGATMGMGMNRIDRTEDKFKGVMDWGTPRLVTKNRQLVMDPNQLKQRNFLQQMAAERKGAIAGKEEEKK
jgi:hypothetical protein